MNYWRENNPERIGFDDGQYSYMIQRNGKTLTASKMRKSKKTLGKLIAWKHYNSTDMEKSLENFYEIHKDMKLKLSLALSQIIN